MRDIDDNRSGGSGGLTYVVDGATLQCTLGGATSTFTIPSRNVFIQGSKRGNVDDHVGGVNIHSFGPCARADPPPPCIMATVSPWINGKSDVLVEGEQALTDKSINICACGGVVSVVDDGQ